MKPRIKMHQMPGDVPKRVKIALLEGRVEDATLVYGKGRYHRYTNGQAKTFKKVVRMKERAVLKRRARKEIERS